MGGIINNLQKQVPCLMSPRVSFILMTFLLGGFFLIEVVVGYLTNSMALIADSFHMLSDVASLIVGYLALRFSSAESHGDTYTYGYARAEVLGALVNAVFLVALCFSIFIESLKRLIILEGIENPTLVFFVGLAGLIVNIFGMFLFHQTGHGHSHGGMSHGHSHGGGGGGGHGHSHGAGKHNDDHSHISSAGHRMSCSSSEHGHSHGGGGSNASHGHSHGAGDDGHGHSHGGGDGGGHGHSHGDGVSHGEPDGQSKSKGDSKGIQHVDLPGVGDSTKDAIDDLSFPKKGSAGGIPSQDSSIIEGVGGVGKPGGATLDDVSDIEPEKSFYEVGEDEKDKLIVKSPPKGKNVADPPASRKQPPGDHGHGGGGGGGKSANQLNVEGVYLHILGDALGSLFVMIAALFLIYGRGDWTLYVDPGMSIVMVMIILKTSIPLLMETSKILMNSAPQHIQINDLREKLLSTIPEIKNVHELHVWQLAGDKIIASVHVKFESPEDYDETAAKIKDFFHMEGIHSTTVQIEFARDDNMTGYRGQCMVVCSLDSACDEMMCCKPEKE